MASFLSKVQRSPVEIAIVCLPRRNNRRDGGGGEGERWDSLSHKTLSRPLSPPSRHNDLIKLHLETLLTENKMLLKYTMLHCQALRSFIKLCSSHAEKCLH